jgi:hypothetical protein
VIAFVVLISRASRRFCPGTTVCCGVIDVEGVSLLDGVTDEVGVALLDGVTDEVGVALLDGGVTDEEGVALEEAPHAVRTMINSDVSVIFFIF